MSERTQPNVGSDMIDVIRSLIRAAIQFIKAAIRAAIQFVRSKIEVTRVWEQS